VPLVPWKKGVVDVMFKTKIMSEEDFEFAIRVTDEMNWDLSEWDFKFTMQLEPQGCFVLLDDSEKVGLAMAVTYGKLGWIGNVIVSECCRKKGAGSFLVKHCVDYLKGRGAETVGLYAYLERINFYQRLGLKYDSEFAVLKGTGFSSEGKPDVKSAEKTDWEKIAEFDASCFGGSRRNLLESILTDRDNSCYILAREGQMSGYLAAKVYGETADVGPLMVRQGQTDPAISLLEAMFDGLRGVEVSMCIPQKETAILQLLKQHGFDEKFRVARMFLGVPISWNCIYAAESLERG